MHTKNQISFTRKTLNVIALLAIFLSAFGAGNLPIAHAREAEELISINQIASTEIGLDQDICMIDGTVQISTEETESIKSAVTNAKMELDFKEAECFAVIDLRDEGEWHLLTLVGVIGVQEGSDWNVVDNGVWSDLVIVHFLDSSIEAGIAGTLYFSKLLSQVPESIFSEEAKNALDPLVEQVIDLNALDTYVFPFENGRLVKFFRFHSDTSANFTFWTGANSKAVDIGSDGNTGANHAPNRLLAVASGWVRQRCSQEGSYSSTYIAVENDDGNKIVYAHINKSSAPTSGTHLSQGQDVGTLKTGNFTDGVCGFANQASNEFHVHFEVPNTSSLTLSDWTLNTSTGIWTRGSETWTAGQYKQIGNGGGGTCTGPSLSNPSNDYVSSTQTINFSWSAPSGCTFEGFTFRIKDTSNMDSGGTTIVDTGNSSTSRTETIGSEWNNRDLYWGVRTANPLSPNWSVRHFRIEPQNCPSVSGIVRLFDGQNCGTPSIDAGLGLMQLEQNNFNDRAESIAIPSGWSARLYQNDNENSNESACFSSTDSNLNDNTFANGGQVGGYATWMRVYNNTSCSGGSAPGAPSPGSPTNGQSFNEGESINLSWSSTGNEYYGEVWGGPAGTTFFDWQTGTSKNIGSQWAGYVYTWHVKARNSYGESGYSFAPTFFVRPGVPGNLSASVVSCSQINLSWSDNSGNEEGYKVYRNGSLIATLGSGVTSYPDTGLSGSTNYSYTVKAYRGSIESNSSNTASVTTSTCSASTPSLIGPTNGQSFNEGDAITLSWSATGSEYYGEIWGGPGGTLTFGWQSGTSKNIGSQWAGYTYSWHIKARNGTSESGWSETRTFIVRPGAPSNLSASTVSCSQINLSWADNSGNEEGYKVYRNGSLIATLGSGVTSYPNTGLSGNTNYSYTVKAYRGSIDSNSSNTANATTQTCPNPPSANFDAWALSGTAPFTSAMHIVDTSNITSCSWSYGDGQTGTSCASSHNHTYNTAGTFTVSLTVSGPGGSDSMTRTNYITVSGVSGDSYEPDNTSAQAKWIYSGSPQTHNIIPATDVDWVKFTLSATSAVTLETTGPTASDTRMWLYDSNLTELKYSDDEGEGNYSYINLICGVDALPAGTYYVKIDEYFNDSEIPGYQNSLITTACIPGAATLLSPTGNIGTNYNPTYTWNQVATATYYLLNVNGPSGVVLNQWYTSAQANCNGSTCSVASPTLGVGAHTWKVQTWNSIGYGPFSAVMNFSTTPIPLPPAATLSSPTGNIGHNYNPTYTWNQVAPATYYLLNVSGPFGVVLNQWYTSAQANCNGSTCSMTPATTLGFGAYSWYVQTWNSVGYGPVSTIMSFNTLSIPPPLPATLSSPSGNIGTNYNPTYTWNQVPLATYYLLNVSGPSGVVLNQWYTSAQANCNGSTCSVTPATTLGGGAHTWYVQYWSPAGYGPWSAAMNFSTIIPPAPTAPLATTLSSPSGNIGSNYNPTYTWNQVSNSTYYLLNVSGPSGVVLNQWYTPAQANCNGSTCSVASPTLGGGAHTWKVQTWNSIGYGPFSAIMNFSTTILPTPTAPGAATLVSPINGTVIGTSTPTYTWNQVSNSTYYYLWVNGPSGNVIKQWYSSAQANCNGSTCSVASSTLGGGAHTWWVQTWNSVGYGPWSAAANFTR